MSQSKRIVFTSLLCLLFFTPELYALETNELSKEKQKPPISLNAIAKSLSGKVHDLGKTLGRTLEEIDYFVNDAGVFVGELAESSVIIATVFLYAIIEQEGYFYDNYFDSGYRQGYDHSRPRGYNDGY